MDGSIYIRKAILHILDNSVNIPVLSQRELEIDSDLSDFLEKHLMKILNDHNLKSARFMDDTNKVRALCDHLNKNPGDFVQVSMETACMMFDIMTKHVDIAPADLICCMFSCDNQPYFAILKLNYKMGFTHFVSQEDDTNTNTIIRHRTLLPSDSQRIDECVLVSLEDYSIKLLDKEYEINGEKDLYLTNLFLGCSSNLSNNEKLKILDKAAKKINKKYFDEDFDKMAKLKKVVSESLEEAAEIQVNTIVQEVFENNLEIQKEYLEEVEKAGLTERAIVIPEELAAKKFKSHKIKTDTGVEINFPPSYYDDKEKMEFINNPDGTISIIIKNVGKIINR